MMQLETFVRTLIEFQSKENKFIYFNYGKEHFLISIYKPCIRQFCIDLPVNTMFIIKLKIL